MVSMVRTRFAPSPTGFLHLGGARTALFSWAFAKHFGGKFVLRIEDTDIERSTPEAVQAILEGMAWLGLKEDEGPFYQLARIERHKEVIQQLIDQGDAYYCYSSKEEVEAMRELAKSKGEKPRYDGTWRPEEGKTLPSIPEGRSPVVRFKNPKTGDVVWQDLFKGEITVSNEELDDLIIARADGVPTYNFSVVVDDWDMQITHVIRGDDHVNNTPRQINLLKAIGAPIPTYGHVPMILGADGQKLSKRHGAVSVIEYDKLGYLPEAMINYLARLGWSHGDDELFSCEQLIEWFNGEGLTGSPARWDDKKLNWVNAHYIKQLSDEELVKRTLPHIEVLGGKAHPDMVRILNLFKARAETLVQLAQSAMMFCGPTQDVPEDLRQAHLVSDEAQQVLKTFVAGLEALPVWDKASIHEVIQATLATLGIKMKSLGIPVRVAVVGQKNTPSVDEVLEIFGREYVVSRIKACLV